MNVSHTLNSDNSGEAQNKVRSILVSDSHHWSYGVVCFHVQNNK